MISIIEAILFIAIPLAVILVAGFLGFRRNIIQSSIKLGSVILSIFAALLIVKFVLPTQVDSLLSLGSGLIEENIPIDFKSSEYALDLFRLIIAMLMPLLFTAVFFVMNSLFSLLYLIPGRLFSNKAIARRAANKDTKSAAVTVPESAPQAESATTETENTIDNKSADSPVPVKAAGTDWKKIGLRAGSIACSILAGILVLSSFMLPVSFYAGFAASCVETVDFADIDPDSAEIVDVVHEFDDHFTVNCYQVLNLPVSASLDSFQSHTGIKVVATDTFIDFLEIIGCISSNEPTSDECYKIADKLDENLFLNETITGVALDILDILKTGESVDGDSENATPSEYIELLDTLLRDDRPFSVVMRLMGDVLSMSESMESDDPDALGNTVESIVCNMQADTASAFKDLLETSYGESVGENADLFKDFSNAVLDSVIEIQEDTSLDDEEREVVLKQEAESLTKILELSMEEEDIDLVALVDVCITSETLTDAVLEATNDGAKQDPYGLAESFTDDMVQDVCNKLQQNGIQQGSSTYKAYLALIIGA